MNDGPLLFCQKYFQSEHALKGVGGILRIDELSEVIIVGFHDKRTVDVNDAVPG